MTDPKDDRSFEANHRGTSWSRPWSLSTWPPSTVLLVGLLGGMGVGALCTLPSPKLPLDGPAAPAVGVPDDATAARVFSKVPDPKDPAIQEAAEPPKGFQASRALAGYYALARLPRPWDTGEPSFSVRPATRFLTSTPAVAVASPAPAYPALAGRIGAQGTLDVTVLVDKTGFPATVSCPQANLILQKAALDAATQWRFRPATVDGKPVPGTFVIHFDFRLPEGAVRL